MYKSEYYEWHPIAEFPNSNYEINKMGQIRNKTTNKILKPTNKNGYAAYSLLVNGKVYYRMGHILVAKQFIPNPDKKPIVNHKDENRSNACVDNLEWVTAKENSRYGTAQKRKGKYLEKPINEYTLEGKYVRTWKSITALAEFLFEESGTQVLKTFKSLINQKLIYNNSNERKLVFAYRVFMYYDDKCDDLEFTVVPYHPRQGKNKDLRIDDNTIVPEKYIFHKEDKLKIYYETVERLSKVSSASKLESDALNYALKCIDIVNRLIPALNGVSEIVGMDDITSKEK